MSFFGGHIRKQCSTSADKARPWAFKRGSCLNHFIFSRQDLNPMSLWGNCGFKVQKLSPHLRPSHHREDLGFRPWPENRKWSRGQGLSTDICFALRGSKFFFGGFGFPKLFSNKKQFLGNQNLKTYICLKTSKIILMTDYF